ncbi:MAG: hypothetical protein COY39_02755 [Alphaproteobacteria bacterium CG_4_10_14_0_8_um_filter_37_21]|nr:MAG: hypothetical protein COY39_02755 [Alphaproteobacteria bacterium CG_4_10_14_0_8_um_filter_37_21]
MLNKLFEEYNSKLPYVFFLLSLSLFLGIFFPGKMSPDSQTMYAQALAHSYSDHHPPLISFVWHYLNLLIPGTALMFLVNMILLWGGLYILAFNIFKGARISYLIILIPYFPQVAVYGAWIWKDVIFTYGYVLLSLYLSDRAINNKPIKLFHIPIFFTILSYATAVKFQAQFILPILLFFFFQILLAKKLIKHKKILSFLASIIMSFALIFSIEMINSYIVNQKGNGSNYSWQYVKIYDLTGMSLISNQILIPKTLLKHDQITLKDIEKKWDLLWEPLICDTDSPLISTRNAHDREELLNTWWSAVLKHPITYLHHRLTMWLDGIVLAAPSKNYIQKNLFIKNETLKSLIVKIASIFSYIVLMPFQLSFFWVGWKALKKNSATRQYGKSLMFLTTMGMSLLFILLFKSLAATPRYICFTFFTFFISVPFALKCLSQKQQETA